MNKVTFIILILIVALPFNWVTAPVALSIGLVFALVLENPFLKTSQKLAKYLLQFSIVGLGFGIDINSALEVSQEALLFTVGTIIGTLFLGVLIGKILKINEKISHLISSGTAICGGSAIAAISPVIKANDKEISVSLGIIFMLNSVALFVFPVIGEWLNLSQSQFGIWAAIAIHDTSSVIGAASYYGEQALQTATTIKLGRALWIIPLVLIEALLLRNKVSASSFPYFIIFFVVAMIINSIFQESQYLFSSIQFISKKGLIITLFLIGSSLSLEKIKEVGFKPFLQGVLLWLIISISSLLLISNL